LLDYCCDSIINSVSDMLFMIAAWLPVWLAVALGVFIGVMIRDNLTLSVNMFVWVALDVILDWQQRR
jgi:hypothetical protein